MSFGARAVVLPEALQHNLRMLRDTVPGCRVMAVIKANAYGHGLVAAARALAEADAFAVARLAEARRLRDGGIRHPLVLLEGVWDVADQAEAFELGCELVIHCEEQIELLSRQDDGQIAAWLKVDTGMHRLGFSPAAATAALARLRDMRQVRCIRLMTHFARADEKDSDMTERQLEHFVPLAKGFDGDVSVANSPAAIGWQQVATLPDELGFEGEQWIRPGIALYGVSPFDGESGASLGLRPAMRFEARLIAKKPVRSGETVGYKGRYRVERDTVIGVLAAGYGDGYSRHFRDGTPVLLNGRRVSLAGLVSMDLITVDLGPDATDRVGDTAILWGEGLPVEEVAGWADTIPYTLLCGVTHRERA